MCGVTTKEGVSNEGEQPKKITKAGTDWNRQHRLGSVAGSIEEACTAMIPTPPLRCVQAPGQHIILLLSRHALPNHTYTQQHC